MRDKLLDTIRRYNMLSEGDNVIAAVSGGADSIALLHSLYALSDELHINLSACHINHNLRGEESLRDEKFVRSFCDERKIPLSVFSIDVMGSLGKHESVEERARKMRYECFSRLCKEKNARLATAHTASDNVETVLINILRGTGTKGLSGIPPVRDNIIRPLLRCTREDIESYCDMNSLSFVTDSTNLSDDYMRNRLRHNVIPVLKEFNPSLSEGIARMTASVYDDNSYLNEAASDAKNQCRLDDGYSSIGLSGLHKALLSRIISDILSENGIEPSALRIGQCTDIIMKGMGKVNLCRNRFAVVRKKVFRIIYEEQNYRRKSI